MEICRELGPQLHIQTQAPVEDRGAKRAAVSNRGKSGAECRRLHMRIRRGPASRGESLYRAFIRLQNSRPGLNPPRREAKWKGRIV